MQISAHFKSNSTRIPLYFSEDSKFMYIQFNSRFWKMMRTTCGPGVIQNCKFAVDLSQMRNNGNF
jgi:hypothetical protein